MERWVPVISSINPLTHNVLAAVILALVWTCLPGASAAQDLLTQAEPVKVRAKPIPTFHIGSAETRFGPLTFLGGLEILGSDRKIGGLSGLVSLDEGQRFLAVTDNGHWVTGDVTQGPDGRPDDISNVRFAPLLGSDGKTLRARWGHDTEALALSEPELYVTAETRNAVYHYPWPLQLGSERMVGQLALPEDVRSLPRNSGLEALAAAPADGPLQGALVAVAESSPSDAHDLQGFIFDPTGTKRFSIKRRDGFDATDAVFLPDGDFLLMERRFNLRNLIGMRLRRFDGEALTPGAVLDGQLILEADFNTQIDNMEAMSVHQTAAGETILTLVSDNNRSLLQRTVFLRFRLDG
ncbi:hypothetical protein E1180_17550 [Roseibium denhamense]|nr:esterase-like activity of phytase family protein [Roseibium denhamense]MTI07312.1 hypothetical protein [Roseibium denhamense]